MRQFSRRDDVPPEMPPVAQVPEWGWLRQWIRNEVGSQNQSRFTFRRDMPSALRARALALEVPCVHCHAADRRTRRVAATHRRVDSGSVPPIVSHSGTSRER